MLARTIRRPLRPDLPTNTRDRPLTRIVPRVVQWSFVIFVASTSLEALSVPYITSENMTLPKLFGFVFFAFYFFHSGVLLRKPLPPIPRAAWWFIGYFLAYSLTGLVVSDDTLMRYVSQMLKLGQLFALLWFASDLMRNFELAKKCLLGLGFACVFLATGTLLGIPGFGGTAGQRLTTLEFSPNTIASLMTYAALILIGLSLTEPRWSIMRRSFTLVSTFPLFGLIVSSGSRAAIGSLVIGVLIFFAPHRGSRRQVVAFFVGIAALAGILFFLQSSTALERWDRTMNEGEVAGRDVIYQNALEMIAEKPITGWGGSMAFQELGSRLGMQRRDAHNLILYLLLEVGLVGTVPFLIGLGFCFRAAWTARLGRFGFLPLALITAILAYNMSHTSLGQKVLWLFLGFTLAASATIKHQQNRTTRHRPSKVPARKSRSFSPASPN